MSLWDFASNLFGGGGGSSDPFSFDPSSVLSSASIDPSLTDFLSSTQPFSLDSLTSQLDNIGSTISDIGNVGSSVGSFFGSGGPLDPTQVNLGDLSGMFSAPSGGGGGGFSLGSLGSYLPAARSIISGVTGGGSPVPSAANPVTAVRQSVTPATPTSNVPGLTNTPQALSAVGQALGGSSGGIGGLLSSVLGNGTLLSMIPGIYSAISSKDQSNLGPDAASLRTQATTNQNLINSLSAEAQAEKMGNLPGPALASLEQSKAEQQAAFNSAYNRMGMSGSTAAADDAAALNRANEAQRYQIGLNMAQQGLQQVQDLTGQNVGIYNDLMQAQTQRDEEYMQAMSNLAGAMGKAFGSLTQAAGDPAAAAPSTSGMPQLPGVSTADTGGIPLSTVSQFINDVSGGVTPAPAPQTVAPPVVPASITSNVPDLTSALLPQLGTQTNIDYLPGSTPDTSGLAYTPDELSSIAQSLGLAA